MNMSAASSSSMEVVGVVDVPSGYRFLPTDLELVRDYLCNKITNKKLPSNVSVVEYDIYSTEPWNLPVNNKIDTISSSRTYYFVKLFDGGKRQRVVRPSCDGHGVIVVGGKRRRRGGGGFWKWIAGGRDTRYIRDESSRPIGIKKSFEFHANVDNNKDGTTTITTTTTTTTTWKTNWIMDEYSINSQRSQPWTLCSIRKKDGGDEDDDEVQVLPLPQVQQQEENAHQPDHELPNRELEFLEKIKTIKKRIKVNQMQIWQYQYDLRKLNELRIYNRDIKHLDNMRLKLIRDSEIRSQDRKKKLTISEMAKRIKQRQEAGERQRAFVKVEAAAIRARSYYQVPIPSGRFKRIRISNNI